MTPDYYAFASEADFNRAADAIRSFEAQRRLEKANRIGGQQSGIYVKVVELITNADPELTDREAKCTEVIWDDVTKDYIPPSADGITYDNDMLVAPTSSQSIFFRSNVVSSSKMTVDKVYLVISYPNASESSDWLVVETGGGGSRAYVIITAVTDPANYVGDVITGPDDATIITVGVAIKVKNATANEFAIGYPNFADVVGDVYWLDGFVLG